MEFVNQACYRNLRSSSRRAPSEGLVVACLPELDSKKKPSIGLVKLQNNKSPSKPSNLYTDNARIKLITNGTMTIPSGP